MIKKIIGFFAIFMNESFLIYYCSTFLSGIIIYVLFPHFITLCFSLLLILPFILFLIFFSLCSFFSTLCLLQSKEFSSALILIIFSSSPAFFITYNLVELHLSTSILVCKTLYKKEDLKKIKIALERYKEEHKEYPPTQLGLNALFQYLNEIPKDPWGNSYFYKRNKKVYELKCLNGWSTREK